MAANGLHTAVPSRQKSERIPITFSVVDLLAPTKTSTSRARRSEGYDAIVGLVSGTAAFTVEILGAPAVLNKQGGLEQPGAFVLLDTIVSSLDSESGRQLVIIERQIRSTFVKVRITAGVAKVEQIQQTIELIPIYAWRKVETGLVIPNPLPVDIVAPLPVPVIVIGGGGIPVTVAISGIQQVPIIESVAPLGAGATFTGAAHDCTNFESFGISVLAKAGAGSLDATVVVENSFDGLTWEPVDSVTLSGGVGAQSALNRVYSVTRQFYRVSVTNNDGANALATTQVGSMLKPI